MSVARLPDRAPATLNLTRDLNVAPCMNKRQPVLIELQNDDLEILMGDDIEHLPQVLANCFCGNCSSSRPMADGYEAYLDALNDVLLLGSCTVCGATMQRHLELGENEETSQVADHIRYIKQHYKSTS